MSTATEMRAAVRAKEFEFPLSVEWLGGRRVAVKVEGKEAIEIAPPPVFQGTDPTAWSPEDFLVAAAASCLAVTFTGLAERDGLGYRNLKVDGTGICGKRNDGHFGRSEAGVQLGFRLRSIRPNQAHGSMGSFCRDRRAWEGRVWL